MIHQDHVFLIKKAITKKGGVWADFGSGWGAFTLALRDLGGQEIQIYSVDKNKNSLSEQQENFENKFPNSKIDYINSDFTKSLELPKLDGILMANSLHYIKDQVSFLKMIKNYLKPNAKLVIVEYNSDHGNLWVPHPFSQNSFLDLANKSGFKNAEILEKIKSDFLNEIYSAQAMMG